MMLPTSSSSTARSEGCIHRSTKLSIGNVEDSGLRCAYHGWLYGADGRCLEIPACPDQRIPTAFRLTRFDTELKYDLIWVRLDSTAALSIPGCPAWDDDAFRVVGGTPYTWPTSAARRMENFVDLAHFPFVHDGSLGERDKPVFPIPEIDRVRGEMRFKFSPAEGMDLPGAALMAPTDYRLWVPFTVNLEFFFPDGSRSMVEGVATRQTVTLMRE